MNKHNVKDRLKNKKDARNQVIKNTMVIVLFINNRIFDIKYLDTMFII